MVPNHIAASCRKPTRPAAASDQVTASVQLKPKCKRPSADGLRPAARAHQTLDVGLIAGILIRAIEPKRS